MMANDMEIGCMESITSVKSTNKISPKRIDTHLQNAYEYIYSIDFSMIINKLVQRYRWLQIEAEEACKQYRNYLWLLKKYGTKKPLPPSEDIDEFWHHHILDTRKYINDCEMIFGDYLQHYPYYGLDKKSTLNDLNAAFSKTLERYKNEFGVSLYRVRLGKIKRTIISIINFFCRE